MVAVWTWAVAALAVLAACNVPSPPGSTGGVVLQPGPCGRGLVVASSGDDYASTNISLTRLDGEPVSPSFFSSAEREVAASSVLSGDVVLPLQTPPSGHVVLIDRQNGSVTWVDPITAHVVGQVSLTDGHAVNPHDYYEVSNEKAYVSRHASGDLRIVDLKNFQAGGVVTLPQEQPWRAGPDRMVGIPGELIVVLQMFNSTFDHAADGQLVGVATQTDSVSWSIQVKGKSNCGGLALSPSGERLALLCTGVFPGPNTTNQDQIGHSGVVLFDVTKRPPLESGRYDVANDLGVPVGWTVAFPSEGVVLGRGVGDLSSGRPDVAFALDLASGKVSRLAEAPPYSLGDVRCSARCGEPCLMTDASLRALRRWRVGGKATIEELSSVVVDTTVGLRPRALGGF